MKNKLHGVIPPLLTPLLEDRSIDIPSLEKLVEHCIAGHVDGVFVLGSCGEGSAVSASAQRVMVRETCRIVAGRVPVLVGVLETSALRVIEQIQAMPQADIDGFVVTVPYYLINWSKEQVIEHFRQIAQSTDKDIILYNIPGFTSGYELEMDVVETLLQIPNIVAVKDSTNSWAIFQQKLIRRQNVDFALFCGNEDFIAPSGLFTADGCVPCMGNPYPAFLSAFFAAAKAGDVRKAFACQEALAELKKVFSVGGSWIAVVKYLCVRQGLMQDWMAVTASELREDQKARIEEILVSVEPKLAALSV